MFTSKVPCHHPHEDTEKKTTKNSIRISLARSKFKACTCKTEVQRRGDTLDLVSSEFGSAFQFVVNWGQSINRLRFPPQ
jgi:hypothetical protein